jgi:tetratricopeptide (TPR) repeat protein
MHALRLDPDLGEARAPLAAVLWLYDWQWPEAKAEFERSIALNPAYPTSNHWYAEDLMTMGQQDEAIARMKKSQELDPLSLIISVAIGWAHYMARRYDDSMEQLRRTIELDPHYPVTYWILGLLLRKMERYGEAIAEGERSVALSGGSPIMRAALAQTLAVAGEQTKANQILDDLLDLSQQKYVASYFLSGIYLGLAQQDRAMDYLEKAKQEHSHWLIYLHIDPAMDALRTNSRFQTLLQNVGLPL